MKILVSNATNEQLNYLVALCKGYDISIPSWSGDSFDTLVNGSYIDYKPSTDWGQGGEIVQQLLLDGMWLEAVDPYYRDRMPTFKATPTKWNDVFRGETMLIAAMRCYVASVYGDEVDIPEELL